MVGGQRSVYRHPQSQHQEDVVLPDVLEPLQLFDGNIPGNDFQFPVSIEGVPGYNNAIQLTQPMHMQDLKYSETRCMSFGDWIPRARRRSTARSPTTLATRPAGTTPTSSTSRASLADLQDPRRRGRSSNNLARYAEGDIKGQLAKYDTEQQLSWSPTPVAPNRQRRRRGSACIYNSAPQERTETAFWYSGARAAAEAYALIGRQNKADEMNAIADRIRTAILTLLWDDGPIDGGGGGPVAVGRVPGKFGNAVRLGDVAQYATLPAGLVTGVSDFTVSVWVNPVSNQTWSRVFDFGTGTTQNMFLTVNAGGAGVRYAITTGGGGAEQRITYRRLAAGQSVEPRRGHAQRDDRATVPQRRRGGHEREHDAAAVQPGPDDPELDRPLAVRRPGTERDRRRLPVV